MRLGLTSRGVGWFPEPLADTENRVLKSTDNKPAGDQIPLQPEYIVKFAPVQEPLGPLPNSLPAFSGSWSAIITLPRGLPDL